MFDKYSTKNLIKSIKARIRLELINQEVGLEIGWALLNRVQKEVEKLKNKIKKNIKEIEEEKKKAPGDWEKITKLNAENIALGYTGQKDKSGQETYEEKSQIGRKNSMVEIYHQNIQKIVGERESLKLEYRTIRKLERRGAFKAIEDELKKKS